MFFEKQPLAGGNKFKFLAWKEKQFCGIKTLIIVLEETARRSTWVEVGSNTAYVIKVRGKGVSLTVAQWAKLGINTPLTAGWGYVRGIWGGAGVVPPLGRPHDLSQGHSLVVSAIFSHLHSATRSAPGRCTCVWPALRTRAQNERTVLCAKRRYLSGVFS